jgi:SMC interacting uncharacterized protein involved in chromosome segregation
MTDTVVEKLVQQVANLIGEVNDMNILIRRMSPPAEVINKIHERIDAMYTAIGQIQKELKYDEKRLSELEAQTKVLVEERKERATKLDIEMEKFRKEMSELSSWIKNLIDGVIRTSDEHLQRFRQDLKGRVANQTAWLWIVGITAGFLALGILISKIA